MPNNDEQNFFGQIPNFQPNPPQLEGPNLDTWDIEEGTTMPWSIPFQSSLLSPFPFFPNTNPLSDSGMDSWSIEEGTEHDWTIPFDPDLFIVPGIEATEEELNSFQTRLFKRIRELEDSIRKTKKEKEKLRRLLRYLQYYRWVLRRRARMLDYKIKYFSEAEERTILVIKLLSIFGALRALQGFLRWRMLMRRPIQGPPVPGPIPPMRRQPTPEQWRRYHELYRTNPDKAYQYLLELSRLLGMRHTKKSPPTFIALGGRRTSHPRTKRRPHRL